MTPRLLILGAALLLVSPGAARAQSLFNAAGLGLRTEALDARTRALGGVGIGLRGPALLGSDPAAAADFLLPTAAVTAQPTWVEYDRADPSETGSFQGTRFPGLTIAYPTVKGLVATFGFESFLDQRYESETASTLTFGSTPVEVRDAFVSTGGVSQVRLGVARRFTRHLALGLSVSRYTGSVTRRLVRSFGEGVDTTVVEPFQAGGLWSYSGLGVTGGATVSLGSVAQVAGSMTWSGSLDATASDDTDGASRSYDLPVEYRLGTTVVLAPGLSLNAGLTSADWSVLASELQDGSTADATTSFGVGVELARARLLGRSAPLRLGYRQSDLAFARGRGAGTESVWAGGLGLNLSEAGQFVRAAVDLGLERGERSDDALTERFWRGTLTVRVSGF